MAFGDKGDKSVAILTVYFTREAASTLYQHQGQGEALCYKCEWVCT